MKPGNFPIRFNCGNALLELSSLLIEHPDLSPRSSDLNPKQLLVDAQIAFQECIDIDPANAEAMNNAGTVSVSMVEVASAELKEKIKNNMSPAMNTAMIGQIQLDQECQNIFNECASIMDTAYMRFRQASAVEPQDHEIQGNWADGLVVAGQLYALVGNMIKCDEAFAEAYEHYQRGLSFRPTEQDIQINFANAHYTHAELKASAAQLPESMQLFETSERELRVILETSGNSDPIIFENLGAIYASHASYVSDDSTALPLLQQAAIAYNQASQLLGKKGYYSLSWHGDICFDLSKRYAKLNLPAEPLLLEALEKYCSALILMDGRSDSPELAETKITTLYNLACVFASMNQPEEARQTFESIRRLGALRIDDLIDDDLRSLHKLEWFKEIIASCSQSETLNTSVQQFSM
eukprot:TRINITY_DN5434_c0_g1::TRINITY_DN5434_c0_g1_i1::g.26657::m.26657 TRINITY_DN5434_c0_g1::TRINITY_DN5434_c0_g1_i1::g.26657  ORF type:complete len:409 (-),score=27.69,TPR_11/PF13414.1/0.27,TPR_11/PF13414.1/2.7e+02,TPR_11/PF13414.1/0.0091,TPR_11/PF13414.1/3.3e+02,TPR_11/PF13414.1/8.7e+02,TPR_11/PF13414.1/0.035,TPR_17/PF13431.1/8.3e+03,TPR_17/PF13431.1/0.16,TPR_17/PF13431.1/8.1e+02,TPR_17/PF13431.1/5.2e+03,TPR_17/PF13431.1/2.1,TPR_2/PF07719.12/74,TPR_2/PF07719.12/16,TPR_2/PF07719.12/1.6e+03,TPR_2/PF077